MGDPEQNLNIITRRDPWVLYNFDRIKDFRGIRITSRYFQESTTYKISMFGQGFMMGVKEFLNLVNSANLEELLENGRNISKDIPHLIEDNDAYFIVRRALQEAGKKDRRIILGSNE